MLPSAAFSVTLLPHPMKPLSLQITVALILSIAAGPATADPVPTDTHDLVVYGGTAAGVIAAVQAKRMGKTAIVISPDRHLGGLSSGGLGWTDTGNKSVIGGLSRDFYHRVWKEYQKPETWKWQKQEVIFNFFFYARLGQRKWEK